MESTLPPSLTVPSGTPDELIPDDFYAYLPTHTYINRRTREHFTVDAVNGHLKRFTDTLGMKPAAYLDIFRSVQQMSWQPAHLEIIEGMVSTNGGVKHRLDEDCTVKPYCNYGASEVRRHLE